MIVLLKAMIIDKGCLHLLYLVYGAAVVKLLACGARGLELDFRSRPYNFRDWLSPQA